jgi:tRNA (cmo5U34)-methyltransferase
VYESVKQSFDAVASDYDRQRRQLIPCFDDFYGMALSLVESDLSAPRILDLGAGTGLFSGMVAQKHPNAKLTLIDLSDKMLEGARERFNTSADVHYIVDDYSTYTFDEESFDFVVSSLSIHHLTHPAKRKLFAAIHRMLRKGGIFVNADQVQANTPRTDAYYRQCWLTSIHQSGLSIEAINASIERRKMDRNAKPQEQLDWLKQAGFAESDCLYKHLDFAVFYALKE